MREPPPAGRKNDLFLVARSPSVCPICGGHGRVTRNEAGKGLQTLTYKCGVCSETWKQTAERSKNH